MVPDADAVKLRRQVENLEAALAGAEHRAEAAERERDKARAERDRWHSAADREHLWRAQEVDRRNAAEAREREASG